MNDNQDHFNVLRKIQNKPQSTQRELANELGFSLGKLNYCVTALKNKGLIINSQAKYSDNNIVIRNPFYLGLKEIVNRYYFVKKFKLRKSNFLIGCFFSIIKHLILFFTFKPSYLIRIIGNIVGLIKIST